MKQIIDHQAAFILHRRPFKESSFYLDVFSKEYGRLSLLAKGARRVRSGFRGRLELFTPLSLSWQGKTNYLILTKAELAPKAHLELCRLTGKSLLCAFYLNELLIRVLERDFPLQGVFHLYQETLQSISKTKMYEVILRLFEKKLLAYLGYALPLNYLAQSNTPIEPSAQYIFEVGRGIRNPTVLEKQSLFSHLFSGESLLALAQDCFEDPKHLKEAKRLMQLVFAEQFGAKYLKTRELFI